MIKSFVDKLLEQCWLFGRCNKVRADLRRRVLMKLDVMDAATRVDDLKHPQSNRLHRLSGKYNGYWSISINGPWRLVFKFNNGDVFDIELVQYH